MTLPWLVFIESNTSGTGRLFAHRAVELGYRPMLLAADLSRYQYASEDGIESLQVDTQDKRAILRVCRRLAHDSKIGGVTSSSEYFIEASAEIAQQLDVPGPAPDSIRICRDKWRQRRWLCDAAVGIPDFIRASSITEAVNAAITIGVPVVVKPVGGSGSVGVSLCKDTEEVARHAGALLERNFNERGLPVAKAILVEEYITGQEYSVESFGKKIIGITRKHLGQLPHFVEVGHDFPAEISTDSEQVIRQTIWRALGALGIDFGPCHSELRITPAGVKVIEVNPRLAGGYIPELVRLATGIDLIRETVSGAVGGFLHLTRLVHRHASIRFLIAPDDVVIGSVEGLDDARSIPGVVDIQLYRTFEKRTQTFGDFRDRLGHVIAVAETCEEAIAIVERARSLIEFVINEEGAVQLG
jgi:S-sulfo-L-cysteine synthase (3-phospho-L-serine-dependent)